MPISEDFHGIERPEIEIYRFGKQQAIPFLKMPYFGLLTSNWHLIISCERAPFFLQKLMYNKPGKLEQLEHVQEMKNAKKLAKIFG